MGDGIREKKGRCEIFVETNVYVVSQKEEFQNVLSSMGTRSDAAYRFAVTRVELR